MSAEDVLHVGKAIVRNMREKLTDGNSVRLDDFGIFRTSFHCIATENPKDCTVKNIDKVRINFKVATTPFVVATESFTSLSVVATLKLIRTLSIFFTVQSLGFSVAMQ